MSDKQDSQSKRPNTRSNTSASKIGNNTTPALPVKSRNKRAPKVAGNRDLEQETPNLSSSVDDQASKSENVAKQSVVISPDDVPLAPSLSAENT